MEDLKKRFISARRKCIASHFPHLNPEQLKAVMATEGAVLVLAGAGSGKTTVLINRIANIITFGSGSESHLVPAGVDEEDILFLENYPQNPAEGDRNLARRLCAVEPAEPWRVMAITFTNKAANELKSRLESILGEDAGEIWALTFHSACVRILRRHIDRLGFDRSFTIYDTADSERVMKDILKDLNMDEKQLPVRAVLSYISKAKDAMLSPAAFEKAYSSAGNAYYISKIARAFEEYQKRLKAANAVDFDDILLYTVTLLLEHEDVREYYQNRFRYVLIDEYQDTNNLQYLFASLVAGGNKNICVVGDDDQSIYRFRGATIENILNFEKQYKDARVIRLEQNYRSTSNILSAANSVIKNNTGRKGKELWTNNGDGDKICIYEAYDDQDEANFVSSRILEAVKEGKKFNDFAVLYRMNAQSNRIEDSFKRNGIPYRLIGGTRFFDRAEVKDMIAYLSVIRNPDDELRLLRIINNPTRGIGAKTIDTARYIAARDGMTLFQVIENALIYPELSRASRQLVGFAELINFLSRLSQQMPLDEFYEQVMEKSGYMQALLIKNDEESKGRLENIKELKSSIISYMENSEEPELSGFLDEVALFTDIERYDEGADAVVMMTMHSAKGLEFDEVFLVGAEEGIFPGMRSASDHEELEEERRLCYVGITRARKRLNITNARSRMLFGMTTSNKRSRFVEEIPAEYITESSSISQGFAMWEPGAELIRAKRPATGIEKRKTPSSFLRGGYSADKPVQLPDFKKGESVEHKVFGKGFIVSVQPMGGDALLEVVFDGIGTKRLMAKSAAPYMKRA